MEEWHLLVLHFLQGGQLIINISYLYTQLLYDIIMGWDDTNRNHQQKHYTVHSYTQLVTCISLDNCSLSSRICRSSACSSSLKFSSLSAMLETSLLFWTTVTLLAMPVTGAAAGWQEHTQFIDDDLIISIQLNTIEIHEIVANIEDCAICNNTALSHVMNSQSYSQHQSINVPTTKLS